MKQYITFLQINCSYYYSTLKGTPNRINHCKEETNIVIFKYHRVTFSRYIFIYILHILIAFCTFQKETSSEFRMLSPTEAPVWRRPAEVQLDWLNLHTREDWANLFQTLPHAKVFMPTLVTLSPQCSRKLFRFSRIKSSFTVYMSQTSYLS